MLLKLWPITGFQLDQFLHECAIFIVFIGSIHPPCNRGVAVFFHLAPYNYLCFLEGHFPLIFHLNYFLFFFINNVRSCVTRMILSAFCISNFFQGIFLHVIPVLFTAFDTCLSTSTSFLVVSIFWSFEALQRSWDVQLSSPKKIADLHLLVSTGLIKCQDVSVGLDSYFIFSDGDSS